jgi:hypothetical protein
VAFPVALALASAVLAGCLSSPPAEGASRSTTTVPPQPSGVVWLCRPGATPDPCTDPLDATSVDGNGHTSAVAASKAASPKIDCFYVYPTVSTEPGPNANLTVQPQETGVAIAQASRFSQVCRVFAPMYPQGTLSDIGTTPADTEEMTAYDGLLTAWDYYIHYLNDGRGFVIIGHSQGAEVLTKLVQQEIDPNPTLRKRLVSAILLGGNVLVKAGQRTGGYFKHIPTCDSATETGCVIAYSTFYQEPPSDSRFGRADEGPGAVIATKPPAGTPVQVACVDPAKLLGHSALDGYFPTESSPAESALNWWPPFDYPTTWVTFPGLYSGACMNKGGAQWLQVTVHQGSVTRPTVSETLGPTWGLHLDDVNLLLGDLVTVATKEAHAYTGRSP